MRGLEIIAEQIWFTTAEDEANYFTGQDIQNPVANPERIMPEGTYRVIDGEVFRIGIEQERL